MCPYAHEEFLSNVLQRSSKVDERLKCVAAKRKERRKAKVKTRKQRGHQRREPNSKENKVENLMKGTDLKLI